MVSYGLPVLTLHEILMCPNDLLVLLWLISVYKSREIDLPGRFTWFLMVSYGLVLLRNHNTCQENRFGCAIYLVSSGFLWATF